MNDFMRSFYPESQFGGFTDIDGTIAFYTRINALLTPASVILDVGCGRGAVREDPVPLRRSLCSLKGKVDKVIGIDVDPGARDNPFLDEFYCLTGSTWPLADNAVDIIVCDNVLEHVEKPEQFFKEVRRVLKHGGYMCVRTPNRWGYVALAARLIPNRLHARTLTRVQAGRRELDVFPTLYKCNSVRTIKRIMNNNGFLCTVYGYEAEPSYLAFSGLAYFLGVLHQRFAFGVFKQAIFAFGKISKN